jgi:PAS domain S-box-containing protein
MRAAEVAKDELAMSHSKLKQSAPIEASGPTPDWTAGLPTGGEATVPDTDERLVICDLDGNVRSAVVTICELAKEIVRHEEGTALLRNLASELPLLRYAERLATLRTIDRLILSASSAEDLAAGVVSQLRHLLGCEHISIMEARPDPERRTILASSTGERDTWRRPTISEKVTRGATIDTLLRGESIIVEDLTAILAPSVFARWLIDQGVRGLTVVPLEASEQLVGALLVGLDRPGRPETLPPGDETLEILREVANQLAIGLHQIRLREQIARHAAELELIVAQRTAALQASEASFRMTFQQAPMGIFAATFKGQITLLNAALYRMLGYGEGELRGMRLQELAHPEDREEAQHRFARLQDGQTPHYQVEQRYLRKDGSEMQGRLTVSLVRDADGSPAFVFGLLEDITDQKRTQEALNRAEKLSVTGQLVAAVTHEINNPLQSVIGCMGLLQENLSPQSLAQTDPYLDIAMQELRRIGRIVGELRDLHREFGPDDMEPTDLVALVNRVVDLVVYRAEERHVKLKWSPPEEGSFVLKLIPGRIHQVLLNLVFNAIDAMPDGGQISIKLAGTQRPPGVTISLADTGIGIDPDLMPHLFEPFRTTKSTGMGMGLYNCRSIVHEHGGQIDVESTPGRGTTFYVWLPRHVSV